MSDATAENPPAETPKRASRYLTAAEAAAELGVCVQTFRRVYMGLFSDHRPPASRGRGSPLKISKVEFELAVSEGWESLANYRARLGLTRQRR